MDVHHGICLRVSSTTTSAPPLWRISIELQGRLEKSIPTWLSCLFRMAGLPVSTDEGGQPHETLGYKDAQRCSLISTSSIIQFTVLHFFTSIQTLSNSTGSISIIYSFFKNLSPSTSNHFPSTTANMLFNINNILTLALVASPLVAAHGKVAAIVSTFTPSLMFHERTVWISASN